YGEVFQRSDWGPDATVIYFGCGSRMSRTTPLNNLAVWSRGRPLLCHRQNLYAHSYGPAWLKTGVIFLKGNQIAYIPGNDGTLPYEVGGSLTKTPAGWVGDGAKVYGALGGNPLKLSNKDIKTARR